MKTNEMMSQEEVVKVLDDMNEVETIKLIKKGLVLYYDFIDIMKTEAITIMDTNQKVNQMYEAFLKNGQNEK